MSSRAGRRASGSASASRLSSRSSSPATTMIARCRGGTVSTVRGQLGVLVEDRLLELGEGGAGLDAQLVHQ